MWCMWKNHFSHICALSVTYQTKSLNWLYSSVFHVTRGRVTLETAPSHCCSKIYAVFLITKDSSTLKMESIFLPMLCLPPTRLHCFTIQKTVINIFHCLEHLRSQNLIMLFHYESLKNTINISLWLLSCNSIWMSVLFTLQALVVHSRLML
jgi:hypothetical protein